MSRGSEQLSAAWLEEATTFTCCGREINVGKRGSLLRRVAEVRRIPRPGGSRTTEVYCMECRSGGRCKRSGRQMPEGVICSCDYPNESKAAA